MLFFKVQVRVRGLSSITAEKNFRSSILICAPACASANVIGIHCRAPSRRRERYVFIHDRRIYTYPYKYIHTQHELATLSARTSAPRLPFHSCLKWVRRLSLNWRTELLTKNQLIYSFGTERLTRQCKVNQIISKYISILLYESGKNISN